MLRALLAVSLILASAVLASAARAGGDQEKKQPAAEPSLPPQVVEPPPATITIVPYYPRTDTREVWQHYGVNSRGRFVPRVIRTPYGDFYSLNLEPYPWAGLRPGQWRP